jgi:pyrimidine operon attenuation protein/uracil phosphoribosyltransferase
LVGIASGGVLLAERMVKDLKLQGYGVVNGSFHRDDYGSKGVKVFKSSRVEMATKLPFEVDGSHIVLVDDVLDTGRSIRAAINEIFDYGRPAQIDLAVLVDRHRRHLPIEPTFKGADIDLLENQMLVLQMLNENEFRFNVKNLI